MLYYLEVLKNSDYWNNSYYSSSEKNLNLRQAGFDEQFLAGESLLRVRGPATTRDTRIIITILMMTQIFVVSNCQRIKQPIPVAHSMYR
jgi:hypothetical protein